VPIILLWRGSPTQTAQALSAGATNVLSLPECSADALFAVVARAVESHHLALRLTRQQREFREYLAGLVDPVCAVGGEQIVYKNRASSACSGRSAAIPPPSPLWSISLARANIIPCDRV